MHWFSKKNKIQTQIFQSFFFNTPQNYILEWFLTPKKKFTWRIDNPYFIIDKIVSVRKCFGHFVPPLVCLGLRNWIILSFNLKAIPCLQRNFWNNLILCMHEKRRIWVHCKFFHCKFYRFYLCNFSHYSPNIIFTEKDHKSNCFKIQWKMLKLFMKDTIHHW